MTKKDLALNILACVKDGVQTRETTKQDMTWRAIFAGKSQTQLKTEMWIEFGERCIETLSKERA